MSKTVNTTPLHKNKSIISLKDQTNIQGYLGWVQSRKSGCQKLSHYSHNRLKFVWNSECTGFGIRRVI